jgi:hypothetical protein
MALRQRGALFLGYQDWDNKVLTQSARRAEEVWGDRWLYRIIREPHFSRLDDRYRYGPLRDEMIADAAIAAPARIRGRSGCAHFSGRIQSDRLFNIVVASLWVSSVL